MTPAIEPLVSQRINSLVRYLDAQGWESYDPYDGLASPVSAYLPQRPQIVTRLWQQGIRVSPINLRPVLGVPRLMHTKAVSDFLSAFSLLSIVTREEGWTARAYSAAEALKAVRSVVNPHSAWGLRFPFVTRFIYASADEPNIFQTINAINAILDFAEASGDSKALGLALSAMRYLVEVLGFEREGDGIWWRYWNGRCVRILNVSGLMLGLCARLMSIDSTYPYREWGCGLYRFLISHQNEDGSWFYSVEREGHFIDGYHSGYILEGISKAIERGLLSLDVNVRLASEFYERRLIAEDGIPLYYVQSRYPLDGQLVAQTIQTLVYLSRLGLVPPEAPGRSFLASDELLWDKQGYYHYQRRRLIRYRTPMHRWVTGPMLVALTRLLEHLMDKHK